MDGRVVVGLAAGLVASVVDFAAADVGATFACELLHPAIAILASTSELS